MSCASCQESQLSVREDTCARWGLIRKLVVECPCGFSHILSDPHKPEAKGLNMLSVLGGKVSGRGRKGVECWSTMLGMPPPVVDGTYSSYTKHIYDMAKKHAHECQLGAVARLRQKLNAGPDELLDVTVTFDGTWSKRGFVALWCRRCHCMGDR